MNRRKRVIRLALLALVVGLVLYALLRPSAREPVHLGRPLREWLIEFDSDQGTTNFSAAQQAIRAMGTNCLPFLIGYLRSKDPPFHRQWVRVKGWLNLSPRKGGEDAFYWRSRAANACGSLGENGAPAFPFMMEAGNMDPYTASTVAVSLSWMLPRSAPVLTNLMATGSAKMRMEAATVLCVANRHPEIEEMARTALLRALEGGDIGARGGAAMAFQCWTQRFDVIVPALTRALSDPFPSVRRNAAYSLGRFGTNAKPAIPELLNLLQETNDIPRGPVTAMEALRKIDPETAAKASRSDAGR